MYLVPGSRQGNDIVACVVTSSDAIFDSCCEKIWLLSIFSNPCCLVSKMVILPPSFTCQPNPLFAEFHQQLGAIAPKISSRRLLSGFPPQMKMIKLLRKQLGEEDFNKVFDPRNPRIGEI